MGCASSALLNRDEDFSQIGSSAFGHHIVSLTSTTYGLLTLDSPSKPSHNAIPNTTTMSPPTPSPSFSSNDPEVINSWELMAGLDTDSFRFSTPTPKSLFPRSKSRFAPVDCKENSNPNAPADKGSLIQLLKKEVMESAAGVVSLSKKKSAGVEIEKTHQENGVVIYTTTLRGVRKTFEACNAVRAAIQGLGVMVSERDVSMDRGFKEELKALMMIDNKNVMNKEVAGGFVALPQVFVKGKHVGGAEEVLRLQEEGGLHELLEGLPRVLIGSVCDGCGDIRFLPCFTCYGSCKMVVPGFNHKETLVVRCPDCNENGLVLCPICC